MDAYDRVLDALDSAGMGQEIREDGFMYQCPAHDDNTASLSVKEGDDGRVLVYCFAGCSTEYVLNALNLSWDDLFEGKDRIPVQYYEYQDADGKPVIRVTRFEPKGFTQERWEDPWGWRPKLGDMERVPYRLPELVAAAKDETIYLTEGEKDAEAIAKLGGVATTLLGGAGKWRPEYEQWFQGRRVCIVADKDEAGRAGAAKVSKALSSVASDVRVVLPAVGKDAFDHVQAGKALDELVEQERGFKEADPDKVYVPRSPIIESVPFILNRQCYAMLWGPSGVGKSIVMDAVMAAMSKEYRHSILFDAEDVYMEQNRLRRMGANFEYAHLISLAEQDDDLPHDFNDERFVDYIIDTIERDDNELAIFNCYDDFHPSVARGEADAWNRPVRDVARGMRRIMEVTGVSVVLLDHQEDPKAEYAHGGRLKKRACDLYMRVTEENKWEGGAWHHLRIDQLKVSRDFVHPVDVTIRGHKDAGLRVSFSTGNRKKEL